MNSYKIILIGIGVILSFLLIIPKPMATSGGIAGGSTTYFSHCFGFHFEKVPPPNTADGMGVSYCIGVLYN